MDVPENILLEVQSLIASLLNYFQQAFSEVCHSLSQRLLGTLGISDLKERTVPPPGTPVLSLGPACYNTWWRNVSVIVLFRAQSGKYDHDA